MMRDDEIFAEASELPTAERPAFLARACGGDDALRVRVEALLRGHDAAEGFLESAPVERPGLPVEEKPGDEFGPYTLVRKIGEGGYGVVYLAEQRAPVRRMVALKIIKLGMDTKQVIMRFEAERQALALMDHPDIARVFDAGATATGRPFFVMEFVDGTPITKFCDTHGLPVAARLELFARVCVALQHAHQKGIIHRDLKPSNVLVTMLDGVPTPKIIDFGIAKATRGRLTEQTLVTAVEQFIGTPAYMSPEQAELRELDIDTRSDIYSLGVLLYELLAGRPPYDPQSLVRAGVEEIRRIIREVEPARPSTRVSTLDNADRATVARLRGLAPTRLTAVLRGDLDWIVMRCLEKDRDRRYSTAHELADDVRRHLRMEPVVARPPEALYRARRFVARNRLSCASAAVVVTSLLVATVVSVRQAARAKQAEAVARAERADAQRRQEQAESLLTFMLGDFRTELKKLGQLKLLDAVGEKAMAYFASAEPRDLTDTALTRQVKALTQIGETRIDQGRYPEADAAFGAALARASMLTARHPNDADMLFERAQVEYWIGFIARHRGESGKAREWLTRYRDSGEALAGLEGRTPRAQREVISGQRNLAMLALDEGDLAAAQRGFLNERAAREQMLAAAPNDLQIRDRLADVASSLALVAERDGRLSEAESGFAEMVRTYRELAEQQPNVARWRNRLVEGLGFAAKILAITGRRSAALAHYTEAHALQSAIAATDPANRQWAASAWYFRLQLAVLRVAEGDHAGLESELEAIRSGLAACVRVEPTSRLFNLWHASTWVLEARLRSSTGGAGVVKPANEAVVLTDKLLGEDRVNRYVRWDWAQARLLAARAALATGDTASARTLLDRVVEILRPLAAGSNDWQLLDPLAQALMLAGRGGEAAPLVARLRAFDYRPVDPLAASTLGLAR